MSAIQKAIKGACIFLNGLPWVKPVAILTAIVIVSVFVASFVTGRDLGKNATELGIWFGNGIFWAALGKSYFEGRDSKKRGDRDGELDRLNPAENDGKDSIKPE